MYLTSLIIIIAFYGIILFVSSQHELSKEVRQSLPPQDIEFYYLEQRQKLYVSQLLFLIVSFYVIVEIV